MADYKQQVYELLREGAGLNSQAGLDLLEEAVRLADLHQDVDLGIAARQPLMWTARSLLRGDLLTTAFVWCLAQYDRDPRRFAGRNMFTEYRWVIGQLANQDKITRQTLEDMLADFGQRVERAGYSRRHFYYGQQQVAPDLGDRELARAATISMRNHPRDGLSSDTGWELAEEVQTDLFLGEEERALAHATMFLQDRYFESSKTDDVCGGLLVPLVKRGRVDEARALQRRCLRSYKPRRVYYWWFGELLKYLTVANDLAGAVQRYGECQCAIHSHTDPLSRLHFGLDAGVVFDRLVAEGKKEITVRLPDSVPVPHSDGVYPVAELRDWLARETSELADRFDARNGTTYFRQQLQERADLRGWWI